MNPQYKAVLRMTKTLIYITTLLLFSILSLSAQQDANLAKHYYDFGEYEKSAQLFKKLSDQNGYNEYYFSQYLESLMAIEEYEQAEASIKDIIKSRPQNIEIHVAYGNLLERLAQPEAADDQYRIAISKMDKNPKYISNLGNSFMRRTKYDLALETYLKGEELQNNEGRYAYNIAEIYRRKNEKENMIKYFLMSPMAASNRISSVQNYFTKYLDGKEEYELLRRQLYQYVQDDPENIFYPEMIQWVFIQNKDYKKALRQARALDLRLEENGSRIFHLARIAANDNDYETAIAAYQYIIDEKPINSSYYIDAKKELLDTKRKKITRSEYTSDDLLSLKGEYKEFITENGKGSRTSLIILELAELEALYLNNLDSAVVLLDELVNLPGLNNYIKANAKLDLADYYLMKGEVWESTLLYSQVDKEFREDHLGELARFKNAKLSYFIGDFDWAQEQFDILKSATTRLIANDAIDLSVFIMDNANLDTTYAPLALFSEAELLLFQNKSEAALNKLDSISQLYPEHSLTDDVLFAKAEYYNNNGQYELAIPLYEEIITNYPEEIRADNALYSLAQVYEEPMADPEKAKGLYEKLFLEYTDSTYSIDARKNFRRLRGDNIQ